VTTWTNMPSDRPTVLDPAATYAELREDGPIARVTFPAGMTGWVVSRFDDVAAAFSHPLLSAQRFRFETADADPNGSPTQFSDTFFGMDGEDHSKFRRLLGGRFTVKAVRERLEPYIESIVDDHLDIVEQGPDEFDFVQAVALPIPSLVVCKILGVPISDIPAFNAVAVSMMNLSRPQAERERDLEWIQDYIRSLVAEKRRQQSRDDDGLLADLLSALKSGDAFFTEEDVVRIGAFLLVAGHDTTASMISLSTLTLLTQPDHRARVVQEPEISKIAVDELLRFLTIVHFGLARTATQDFEFLGASIRRGETVVASLSAANRDPRMYEHPDLLDFDRQALRHVAFGFGAHQCLGQNVARAELRSVLSKVFKRFPTLDLAIPVDKLRMQNETLNYGVAELPLLKGDAVRRSR